MSRFLTKEGERYIEEIESMELCKWLINEVCCNDQSECCGDYPYLHCESKKYCRYFEKEDGIIKEENQNVKD